MYYFCIFGVLGLKFYFRSFGTKHLFSEFWIVITRSHNNERSREEGIKRYITCKLKCLICSNQVKFVLCSFTQIRTVQWIYRSVYRYVICFSRNKLHRSYLHVHVLILSVCCLTSKSTSNMPLVQLCWRHYCNTRH